MSILGDLSTGAVRAACCRDLQRCCNAIWICTGRVENRWTQRDCSAAAMESFAAASRRPCARRSSGPACGVAGRRPPPPHQQGRTVAPSRSRGISLGAAVWRTGARHIEHRRGRAWRQIDHLPTPLLCLRQTYRRLAPHLVGWTGRVLPPGTFGSVVLPRRPDDPSAIIRARPSAGQEAGTLPWLARASKGRMRSDLPLPRQASQPAGVFPAARADEALRCVIDRGVPRDDTGLRRRPVPCALMNGGPIGRPPPSHPERRPVWSTSSKWWDGIPQRGRQPAVAPRDRRAGSWWPSTAWATWRLHFRWPTTMPRAVRNGCVAAARTRS